jgi:hypothetical protein
VRGSRGSIAQEAAQRFRIRRRARRGDDVAHEPALGERHGRLGDAGMAHEPGLDLGGFDAESAYLELRVGAAEELELAVGAPAHAIAGAIEQPRAEGIGHEALRRELGTVHVAQRDDDAPGVELAGHPRRHGLAMLVEHVEPRSRERASDGRKLRPACGWSRKPVRGDHVSLRGSVVVVQLAGRQTPEEIDQRRGRAQLLARGDHLREPAGQLVVANLRGRLREALQRDERQEQPLDTRLAQAAQQGEGIAAAVVVDHHQRATAGPGRENLLERHVEAHRRELQRARRRREPLPRAAPRDQVGDDAVRYHRALGHARGSRREQDVERVVGRGGVRGDGGWERVDGRPVAIEVDGARA